MTDDNVKAPRDFEPPPWEREQFEELARRRQAEAAPAAPIEGAQPGSAVPVPPVPGPPRAPAEPAAVEKNVEAGYAAPAVQAAGRVDPAQTELMLMDLRAEEPETLRRAWVVPMVAGVPIIVMGLLMAVLGAIGVAGGKASATATQQYTVSGVMLVGSLALLALGGWLVWKSLKTRSA